VAQVAPCENHPEREAIGVCVQCRKRICTGCVTKVDGINYCVSCLEAFAAEGARALPGARRARGDDHSVPAASAYFVLLSLAVWTMLEVLLPGAG